MVDPKVLHELADRAERLAGPDIETDQRVSHVAVQCGIEARVRWATRSIDDAAALMPARWFVRVMKNSHNWWVCAARARGYSEPWSCDTIAATEPLARTACALRALASDIEAKEAGSHV